METTSDTPTLGTLTYAPFDRARRLRKLIVRSVLAVAIVALTAASYIHRSDISTRARRWYWARQCANHVTPPGTKFVISDPFGPRPMAGNPDYISWANAPKQSAFYSPRAWREFAPLIRVVSRPLAAAPVAFLGELRNASGERRIVMISTIGDREAGGRTTFPFAVIHPPGMLGGEGKSSATSSTHARLANVFIRRCDRNDSDPTKLTLVVEIGGGVTETFDAALGSNDVISFIKR